MFTETQKQVTLAGAILGVLLIAAVGYWYFMVTRPALEQNERDRARAATEVRTLTERRNEMRNVINNREEWEELQAKVEVAIRKLPSEDRAIEFLALLREGLQRTGVQQTSIVRNNTVRRNMYNEIPYTIQGFARYHDFGQFVNLIECNPERLMRVNRIDLSNNAQRPSVHPMTIGISTFAFRGN